MAYICESTVPCNECGHYRPDPDEPGRMACFAIHDMERKDETKEGE